MRIDKVDEQVAKDEQIGVGNHWVEGVLHEGFEPAPEQPFHLRNDVKRDENRAEEDSDGGGDVAEGHHGKDGGLCGDQGKDHDHVADDFHHVDDDREGGHFHLEVKAVEPVPDLLHERMVELIGEIESLVDDQVIETDAEAGDRLAVVGDHGKAKGDRDEQTGQLVKVKDGHGTAACRRQGALNAVPTDENHGKVSKHLSAHSLKNIGVLRHKL